MHLHLMPLPFVILLFTTASFAADAPATDIPVDLRIHDDESVPRAVARIKAKLQERGVIFRGWGATS